jgi:hypothetical protein
VIATKAGGRAPELPGHLSKDGYLALISAGGSANSVCGSATMGLLGDVLSAGSLLPAATAVPGENVKSSSTTYCLFSDTLRCDVQCLAC